MLPKEKEMEVLEAYDLTKSYRATAQLTGVDHHSVARVVAARALGTQLGPDDPTVRSKVAEAFADKITEWISRSGGRVRADVVHDKLVAMGYAGSERTTRRVVAALKAAYEHENHRVYRPWITEPGARLQYDFGDGPLIAGTKAILFCAWLAWSRFRVIIALSDPSAASVIGALDATFRLVGGAPTYVLTDNERRSPTVTSRASRSGTAPWSTSAATTDSPSPRASRFASPTLWPAREWCPWPRTRGSTWPSVGSSRGRPWASPVAVRGDFPRPSVGSSRGHRWGVLHDR
jgi:hypothetical protein